MYLKSLLISILVLGPPGLFGLALLCRVRLLTGLERIAYGVPCGIVLSSLSILGVACFAGLTRTGVVAFTLLFAVAAALLWPWRLTFKLIEDWLEDVAGSVLQPLFAAAENGTGISAFRSNLPRLIPIVVIGGFILRWAFIWPNALNYEAECLRADTVAIWGDWPSHLGDVTSFAYGNNFPPQHPRFAGHSFAYHFLSSIPAAAAVKLGADPAHALAAQSFLLSGFVALGVYAFARRLTSNNATASLALVLFFLGGGLGWLITAGDVDHTHTFWETLRVQTWDADKQFQGHFAWMNMYFFFVMPQRGFLFGLPLALLIFTLLLEAARRNSRALFIAAGVLAGLLPLAHLTTMLALALIAPVLALLSWTRRWLWFFSIWVVIALPQLHAQYGGWTGPTSAMHIHLGWIAAPDPWLWFWLKNLGWFLPLLLLGLADRTLLPLDSRRFLWACMALFVLTNIAQFQPWDWNNHIVMVYWFLAVCILVAALLHKLWLDARSWALRLILSAVVASMLLSGILLNLQEWFGHGRHCLLSPEEVMLAKAVRELTRRSAVILTGLKNNNPIATLSGRKVVMGFPGWLFAQGIDTAERERDVRTIYAMAPETPALLRKYNIEYVLIGPEERKVLKANAEAFEDAYQLLLRTTNYEIFSVKHARAQPDAPEPAGGTANDDST